MRFLSINTLKHELRTDSLTDRDAFFYFFAALVVNTLLMNFSFVFSGEAEFSPLDIASALTPTLIIAFATWFLYLVNGGKDGSHFFLRYFSILWVVGVRFLLFSSLLFVVWLRYFVLPVDNYEYEWETFAILNIGYLFFYWRVWIHMRDVSSSG